MTTEKTAPAPGITRQMTDREQENRMTQFEKATQENIVCDICGEIMHPMYGGGWENDRLVCADRECGAEIVYPTSTEVPNDEFRGGCKPSSGTSCSAFAGGDK